MLKVKVSNFELRNPKVTFRDENLKFELETFFGTAEAVILKKKPNPFLLFFNRSTDRWNPRQFCCKHNVVVVFYTSIYWWHWNIIDIVVYIIDFANWLCARNGQDSRLGHIWWRCHHGQFVVGLWHPNRWIDCDARHWYCFICRHSVLFRFSHTKRPRIEALALFLLQSQILVQKF